MNPRWLSILIFSLLLPAAGAQELMVENTTVVTGESAEVPLLVKDAPNIGSMDIILRYSPEVLALEGVGKGELTSRAMLRYAEKEPGSVKIGIVQIGGINGDGSVAVLRFRVKGEVGTSTMLSILAKASDAKTVKPIALKTAGATITVVEKKAEQPEEGIPQEEEKRGICGPTLLALLAASVLVLRRVGMRG